MLLAVTLVAPASADHDDKATDLTLHQQEAFGKTAEQLADEGFSNEPDGCGVELGPSEVGWAFLVPGNASSNYFTHFQVNFEGDIQNWDDDVSGDQDATRVRVQKGNTTLLAFTTSVGNQLTSTDVQGVQQDDRFVLTHVCVDEPKLGSILIDKEYSPTAPDELSEFTVFEFDSTASDNRGDSQGVMDAHSVDDTSVRYCLDELAFGDYIVSETQTPDDFVPADDVEVTVAVESNCDDRLDAGDDPDVDTIINEAEPVNATVAKRKLNLDGPTDTALDGFDFTLWEGMPTEEEMNDPTTGMETVTTESDVDRFLDGEAVFETDLEVDQTYTVCETGVPTGQEGYWTDAEPACQTFTTELGEDPSLTFHNAPKADVSVGFDDVTGFTSVTIECFEADDLDTPIFSETFTGDADEVLEHLDLGDYTCNFEIRNGSA